ncbi:MAG: hypothetical protein M3Z02_13125 [Actinomycetota bacterium]|nr:hypothetical protein [Actinomycetota bacterium]
MTFGRCLAIAAVLVATTASATAPAASAAARSSALAVSARRVAAGSVGTPAAGVPAGLPLRLGLGVSAEPDASGLYGWMADSGVAWDYAYTYLAGGVNTGTGWATWNAAGQYPLSYARGAAARHAVPVFPYYQLLQSAGPCATCDEGAKDLAHLDDPATMAAYFADFRLLMQRLGPGTYDGVAGFGGTAVVHVDPDLSGYAQQAVLDNARCSGHCTGQGNDPAFLHASVRSSGVADVAGYADTYAGYNAALLHLRDVYAPNVVMAFHVSNWAALQDVGSSQDPALDAAALGRQVGAFAAAAGVSSVPAGTSTYDLVVNDVADRDAEYYLARWGVAEWWDRLNVTLPNFTRWETYLGAITATTGRRALVWQVPEGNQYFRSVDGTDGHTADNRAEYFFAHPDELVRIGVIGVLYGAGNAGSTRHDDNLGDGVTNPPARCTADGVSSGVVCNDHVSTVADDDGGYLRMAGASYYRAPLSLTAPGPQPAALTLAASPRLYADAARPVALSAALTASATGGPVSGQPVTFAVRPAGSAVWTALGTAATDGAGRAAWTVARPQGGDYRASTSGSADWQPAGSGLVPIRVYLARER